MLTEDDEGYCADCGVESICGPHHWLAPGLIRQKSRMQWSQDGSALIFDVDEYREYEEAIWAVDADGSSLRRLADLNPHLPGTLSKFGFHADPSPDGSRIAYSTCEFEGPDGVYDSTIGDRVKLPVYEIAVVNIDGTGRRRITASNGYENYPAWSPDGTRLAYIARDGDGLRANPWGDRPGRVVISTLGADTEFAGWITPNQPVWSPNGRYLALTLYDRERQYHPPDPSKMSVLYVAETEDLANGKVLGNTRMLPTWSPDSTMVAFAIRDVIHVASPDGTRVVEIRNDEGWVIDLDWHPDGSEILVVSSQPSASERLWAVAPDGGGKRDLTPKDANIRISEAAWSPDGTRVATWGPVGDDLLGPGLDFPELRIYTMNREGGDVRLLAMGDESRSAGPLQARSRRSAAAPNRPGYMHPGRNRTHEDRHLVPAGRKGGGESGSRRLHGAGGRAGGNHPPQPGRRAIGDRQALRRAAPGVICWQRKAIPIGRG